MGLDIRIRTLPHDKQRYPTVGDWIPSEGGQSEIRVSDMGNEDYEFLVAVHELVEWWLCRKRGVTDEEVSEFDRKFEAKRPAGNVDEPGDDPLAPYHFEHSFATGIERLLASEMGIGWKEYESTVEDL